MRGLGWTSLALGAAGTLLALRDLHAPVPARTDLAGYAMLAISAWLAYLGATLLLPRGWWTWAFPAAWVGLAIATLVLSYKDSFRAELAHFGPGPLALQMAAHALIAPIEVFFGFAVGFADPAAWAYVLACLAFSLLGAGLLRRRLWPRQRESRASRPQRHAG